MNTPTNFNKSECLYRAHCTAYERACRCVLDSKLSRYQTISLLYMFGSAFKQAVAGIYN